MTIIDIYIDRFHNLGGDTVPEHKKNFNAFKGDVKILSPEEIHEFLQQLKPQNNQENLFYLDLLQIYGRYDLLLETLLEGNRILGKLIIRSQDFIKNVVHEDFAAKLCPKLSFVNRNRFINKLARAVKSESLADLLYETIDKRYGQKTALPILPACSESFIKRIVTEDKIEIEDKSLIILHKKYENFLMYYFNKECSCFCKHPILAQYLVQSELATFHLLSERCEPRIGKRAFYKYFLAYKQDVLNGRRYRMKHYRVVLKNVTHEQFLTYFKSMFPKNIHEFKNLSQYYKILKVFPIKSRGKVLFDTYKELYNLQYDKKFDNELLPLLCDKDRAGFVINESDQAEYFGVDESFRLITSQLELTSAREKREELLLKMIRNCKINRDMKQLEAVLEYIHARHKNESLYTRYEVLVEISKSFVLANLSSNHWSVINAMFRVFEIRNEAYFDFSNFHQNFFVHQKLMGKDDTNFYKKIMKKYFYISPPWKCSEDSKQFLLKWYTLLLQIDKDSFEYNNRHTSFIEMVIDHNNRFRTDPISPYKYRESIKILLDKVEHEGDYYSSNIALTKVMLFEPKEQDDIDAREQLLKHYLIHCSIYITKDLFHMLFRQRPKRFCEHAVDFMLRGCGTIKTKFAYEISKCYFNGVADKMKTQALKVLEDPKIFNIQTAVKILSFTQEFMQIVENQKPTNFAIEAELEVNVALHKSILRAMKHHFVSAYTIRNTLDYCNKDFLHLALCALYSSLYNSPEDQITESLAELLRKPVSAKKHGIILAAQLCSITHVHYTLEKLIETEKQKSIRKVILKHIVGSFFKTSNSSFIDILEVTLESLKENDLENDEIIFNFKRVPNRLLNDYLKAIWSFIKNENNDFTFVQYIRLDSLNTFDNCFIEDVIKYTLFNEENIYKTDTNRLVYNYLICSEKIIIERISFIEKIITDNLNKITDIHNLFNNLIQNLIQNNTKSDQLLARHLQNWFEQPTFPLNKIYFKLLIDATISYMDDELTSLSIFIIDAQKDLVRIYGAGVLQFIANFVSDLLRLLFLEDERYKRLSFLQILLRYNNEEKIKLLVIRLLMDIELEDIHLLNIYAKIIDTLAENSTKVVDAYLVNLIKNVPVHVT